MKLLFVTHVVAFAGGVAAMFAGAYLWLDKRLIP